MTLPPYYYRRAWLRAFWVSFVLAVLLALTALRWVFGWDLPLGWLWVAGAAVFGIGVAFPQLVRIPYFAFRHASVLLGRLTGAVLAVVCYFGLLLPMSIVDRPRLVAERPEWRRRSFAGFPDGMAPLRNAPRIFRSTLPTFREPWELALAPFMHLTRHFGSPVEVKQRSDTYTLY